MNNKSIGREMLICQCLSLLPLDDFDCPLMDYEKYKLSTKSLLKTFVSAQLDQWSSYAHMEEKLEAYPKLREKIGISGISASQLSRRINDLPTEFTQKLFINAVQKLKQVTQNRKGLPDGIGRLSIIDSTEIRLPKQLCDWAYISKEYHAVKMHTRLQIVSPDVVFPDKIVPSTGIVGDVETSDLLIEESDSTYLTDRAYPSKDNLMSWQKKKINFLVRLSKSLRLITLEKYTPTNPSIIKDEKVLYGVSDIPLRYVEFLDEKGRQYRILTTRFDLSDEQIMDLYRHRWMIELFFKWIKQHLKLTKIWSTKPQGIWNQMFLALTAYVVTMIVKLQMESCKSPWEFFRLMQTHLYKTVSSFKKALRRKKKSNSKGRQKVPIPDRKAEPNYGKVTIVKLKSKETQERTQTPKLGNY
ncbi:IS4 family transposase [Evansella sp. AB-P1]|uniref:IS4 family transposase n=1 Tax=Evansella sp. AB-P1 TaxID=3037653 RepID=UPI00241DD7C8|nr:IS4 family transposase [Evansella sp. AB-P1]MDG5788948.1 IS4 family transposase [Evansella sp. AB-P1]